MLCSCLCFSGDESIIIEKLNPINECIYLRAPLPPGVTLRDFVQFRGCQFDKASDPDFCLILFRNAAHPKFSSSWSEKTKGHIRGETLGVIGYSVRAIPVPAGVKAETFANRERLACRVAITTCFDMKGWIPKRLVNYVAGKAPITWAINLQKAADKGLGRESASSPLTAGQLPAELILKSSRGNAERVIPSASSSSSSTLSSLSKTSSSCTKSTNF